jgi:O-succinylbenzoic acid--CoA ligase
MPADAPPSKRISTCGKVLRDRAVAISRDGEILVRGPCLFMGFWRDGAIEPAEDAEGWFHTGDLGAIDDDGYLTVAGRRDDLIISGGENIQPQEVEDCLCAITGVERAVVVAVAHPRFGQRPVAFVKASSMDPAGWRLRLGETLASFKVPDAFHPWPDDVDAGIKIPRRVLAARAEQLRAAGA